MKLFFAIGLGLIFLTATEGEETAERAGTEPSRIVWSRSMNSRVVESREMVTDALTSMSSLRTSSYVEVGNGLTYQDENGDWHDSEDLIELLEDGTAAAVRGPNKVRFSANLNSADPIGITSQSNRVFHTRILGLYYFDATSGESVLVAPVQDCSGVLLPPNQMLYEDGFKGVRADVRMTYTKGAFENDVILLEKPLPPEDYGLSASSRLEIWHEFKTPAAPAKTARVLKAEADPEIRAQMKEPDLVDQTLNFGDLWFPLGRAFSWEAPADSGSGAAATIQVPNPADTNQLFVAKQWIHFDQTGTDLLIESVNWKDLAPKLESLAQAKRVASATELRSRVTQGRVLPKRAVAKAKTEKNIRLASTAYKPKGYVLDYITVVPAGDFEFQSGVTYYAGGFFNGGTMTLQPGCIIKMANNGNLTQYGSLACNGTTNSPSILTSVNDDLFGERIAGSTGNPSATVQYALQSYAPVVAPQIKGLRIRWAQYAYNCDAPGDSGTVTFRDSVLEQCGTGLYIPGYWAFGCVSIVNSTICNVSTPTYDGTGLDYAFTGSFTTNCNGDSDSDGLPDSWEITYFGNTTSQNGTGDPDGDGIANVQEFLAGSHPNLKVWITNPRTLGELP